LREDGGYSLSMEFKKFGRGGGTEELWKVAQTWKVVNPKLRAALTQACDYLEAVYNRTKHRILHLPISSNSGVFSPMDQIATVEMKRYNPTVNFIKRLISVVLELEMFHKEGDEKEELKVLDIQKTASPFDS